MKPFVFLTALLQSGQNGKTYDPLTILKDEKFTHKYEGQVWSPDNYGKKYFGDVPMYFALKNSLNSATAQLGLEVGISNVVDTAKALGIRSSLPKLPSVTLGALELYPMEVLEAYTAIARMGSHVNLSPLRGITDLQGQKLFQFSIQSEQKLPPAPVASLVSMMKQTVRSGSARAITLSGFTVPAAGKTGTTSDYKDAWFGGFTPAQTTIVWVGYDNPTSNGLTGASGAVPLWLQFMKKVASSETASDFTWPEGAEVRQVEVQEPESTEPSQVDLVFVK